MSKELILRFINDYLQVCQPDYPPDGACGHYYHGAITDLALNYPDFDYDQFLIDHCDNEIVLFNLVSKPMKFDTYKKVCEKIQDKQIKLKFVDNCVKKYLRFDDATDEDKAYVVESIIKYGRYCKTGELIFKWLPFKPENIPENAFSWCLENMDFYYFIMYFYENKERQKYKPPKELFLKVLNRHMSADHMSMIAKVHGKFDAEETSIIIKNENVCDFQYLTLDFSIFDNDTMAAFVSKYHTTRIPDDVFKNMIDAIIKGKYKKYSLFAINTHSWATTFTLKCYKGVIDSDTMDKFISCQSVSDVFKAAISKSGMLLKKTNWDSIIEYAIVSEWSGESNFRLNSIEMNPAAKELCIKEIIKRDPFAAHQSLTDASPEDMDRWYRSAGYPDGYVDLLRKYW